MKVKLRILNIFYLIISAVAIAILVMNPFMKASIECNINYDVLEENGVSDLIFNDYGFDLEDVFEDLDDEDLAFNVDVVVDLKVLIGSWKVNNPKEFVKEYIITPYIDGDDGLSVQLEDIMTTMTESGINAMYTHVFEQKLSSAAAGQNLYAAITNANSDYTTSVIKASLKRVTDLTVSDSERTIDDVADKFAEEYNKYATALGATERTSAQLRADIEDYLYNMGLCDRSGSMKSIDNAITKCVTKYFQDANKGENISSVNDDDDDEEDDAPVRLEKFIDSISPFGKIKKIDDPFGYALVESVAEGYFTAGTRKLSIIACRFSLIVLALAVLTWCIKVFQFIICLFRKTPYIRIDPLGIISGILQIATMVVALFLGVMTSMNASTLNSIPLLKNLANLVPIGFSVDLSFAVIIPGVLVIVNALYSIIYGAVKRKFKFDYKDQMYGIE